jgi:Transposase IS66 family/Transposase zinc-binding domain
VSRPALEVADIFRDHGAAWRSANASHVSLDQLKVMNAIERCRTAALGGHVARCEKCSHTLIAYNSCRNRHCPKCQGAAAKEWLAERETELLPVPYFHVVFTLPVPSLFRLPEQGRDLRSLVQSGGRGHAHDRGRSQASRRQHRHHCRAPHLGLGDARRNFFDLARLKKAPIAIEAVKRIDALFDIERAINGLSANERRRVRNEQSRPLLAELQTWLRGQRARLSSKSETAKAIVYALKRWTALTRFLEDGRLCMSNNAAERALRCVAVGRRNWTFAGSDEGGRRAAAVYTLIETALCRARHKAVSVLAAAGYNFRRLIRWLSLLLLRIMLAPHGARPGSFSPNRSESSLLHGRRCPCCAARRKRITPRKFLTQVRGRFDERRLG